MSDLPSEIHPEEALVPLDRGPKAPPEKPGYHIAEIPKGVFGEPSKIAEECAEFMDAVDQGVAIMALLELADLVGAIQAYLEQNHYSIHLMDLARMSAVTKRAFENGQRT